MAISSWASALAKNNAPNERVTLVKSATGTLNAPALGSYWGVTPFAGSNPSTAAACTSATAGSIGQQNGGSLQLRVAGYRFNGGATNAPHLGAMLVDRLSHQGGLDGTVTSAQTTNLPTAALTRYTSGVGVFAAIEFYTAVGATPTTVTCSYTNSAGTSGRTSVAAIIGGTAASEAKRLIILPWASGDVGVRSVESVTLAGSTGTAGNFGITLFKPLLPIVSYQDFLADSSPWLTLGGMSPEIFDNACLMMIGFGQSSNTVAFQLQLRFAEDDT